MKKQKKKCNCQYEKLKRYWGTEKGITHNRNCPQFKRSVKLKGLK